MAAEVTQHKNLVITQMLDVDLVKLEYREYIMKDGKMKIEKSYKDQSNKEQFRKMLHSQKFTIQDKIYDRNGEHLDLGLSIFGDFAIKPEEEKEKEKKPGIAPSGRRGRKKKEDQEDDDSIKQDDDLI
jgi:hypothetical protein